VPVRLNNIYAEKIKFKNMYEAYRRAAKGKRETKEVVLFEMDLASNLIEILRDLYGDKYTFSEYRKFKVYDPKERDILSLPFRDRVVHQWYVEEFIKPVYNSKFIKDSYACIEEKGLHLAMQTFQKYMRKAYKENKNFYILKCDIKKYFYSIDKNILYKIIEKQYKDKRFLDFTKRILFQNSQGDVGIPIGNYTSQYFANIYLNQLDHFVKEKLRVKYYIRYMDDFLLILSNKEECKKVKILIEDFLNKNLNLTLNQKTNYFPNKNGVHFCGFRVYRDRIKLSNRNKKSINKRIKKWNKKYKAKKLDLKKAGNQLVSWLGHASHESNNLTVKSVLKKCKWIYNEKENI